MIVGRIAKNSYTWYGRQRLEVTLEELQRRGRQQGYHLQMELTAEARGAGAGRDDDGGEGDGGQGDLQFIYSPLLSLSPNFEAASSKEAEVYCDSNQIRASVK